MKDGTPAWSVVVVVFSGPYNVLAVARAFSARNPALPGGDSNPDDDSPATTAKRELYEETGIQALELRCMDEWIGERGQPVYAFFVPLWKGVRLRTSSEGKPFWTRPPRLLSKTAQYRDYAEHLLTKLGRLNIGKHRSQEAASAETRRTG
jgi:8-oxo-dGTP pyrophosphatase MutT (NUDIX family)